jgi:hypothetical protein
MRPGPDVPFTAIGPHSGRPPFNGVADKQVRDAWIVRQTACGRHRWVLPRERDTGKPVGQCVAALRMARTGLQPPIQATSDALQVLVCDRGMVGSVQTGLNGEAWLAARTAICRIIMRLCG